MASRKCIAIVTRETRLAALRARWGTVRQAQFVLAQAHAHEELLRSLPTGAADSGNKRGARSDAAGDADFLLYEQEDQTYRQTLDLLEKDLDLGLPLRFIDRSFVPNFDFWNAAAVVVVGQDGLVANAAKYVGELPIIAVNPDPERFDGILLPFRPAQARAALRRVLDNKHRARRVTLAEVRLNDGQSMLAFNDFFLGCATHTSARYTIEFQGRSEPQSSSGVLVSTGAGSTGWLSSVFNMTAGINQMLGADPVTGVRLPWEDRRLLWAVREPFVSKHSRAELVAGLLADKAELTVESLMPNNGVIFSDGIESDFLQFNSGAIARVSAARQSANLVVG